MNTMVLAILGSSLATAVFEKLFDYFTRGKKTDQILLLGEIERMGEKCLAKEKITQSELKRFMEAYEQYHAIGGNGYADAVKSQVTSLPIVTEGVYD